MLNRFLKTIGLFAFCAAIMTAMPFTTYADQKSPEYQTSTSMVVRVEEAVIEVYAEPETSSEVVGKACKGETYDVLEMTGDKWARVHIAGHEGYMNVGDTATTVAETVEEVVVNHSEAKREEIIEYAKQFIGNPYVWGGTDPHRGADCSGFTSYILRNVAGVHLSHSSRAQVNEGRRISVEEVRPGDLVFYGSGSRINHVAIYAGNGQIVHASTERTGIKISRWDYRAPIAVVNVLGD